MNPKITSEHLNRGAVVYVRQSTPGQVAENTESQRLQYALAESASTMGFAPVTIIDDDLGRTGSGLIERPGFQKLVAAVCGVVSLAEHLVVTRDDRAHERIRGRMAPSELRELNRSSHVTRLSIRQE